MAISITTAAERPELIPLIWEMPDGWPEFMDHDLISDTLFAPAASAYRDLCIIATDTGGRIVGHAQATAFQLDRDGRRDLPDDGWDAALVWACNDLRREVVPDVACALEASVHPEYLGQGLSIRLFDAAMSEYALRIRADGLPADAWLRVHARLGGVIEQVAPFSQTIVGSLADWERWTGVTFDRPGPVLIPHGLAPVHCAPELGYAVYVEPNVWVRHTLT